MNALLCDFGPLSCACTDHALESIYKALSDGPEGDALFAPHEDPFIRQHVEVVTERGLAILAKIQGDVIELLSGKKSDVFARHKPGTIAKALTWVRLKADELEDIRAQLASKSPATYTLDDWRLAVDWIVSRYLMPGTIETEAAYLAVKAQIIGKIQASMSADTPQQTILDIVRDAPITVAGLPFHLSELEAVNVEFARARAAELITNLGDRTRAAIKQIILTHEQARVNHDTGASMWKLQQSMRDQFGVLNRDWRRIALTESARDVNEGMISALPDGTRVKRVEAYAGACPFCKKIHGSVYTVVSPHKPDKNGATEVWVGKTNMDRSASPRKREGDVLVDRDPAEMWWPAAGTQHPNCRGGWVVLSEPGKGVNPEFESWMREKLAKA